MRHRLLDCFVALLLAMTVLPALADNTNARANALFRQLRCVVCEGESVAESQAEVARDLREEVRRRLAAGESEEEIKAYLVSRYGEFILMQPPFEPITYALWLGPLLMFMVGGGVLAAYFGQRRVK